MGVKDDLLHVFGLVAHLGRSHLDRGDGFPGRGAGSCESAGGVPGQRFFPYPLYRHSFPLGGLDLSRYASFDRYGQPDISGYRMGGASEWTALGRILRSSPGHQASSAGGDLLSQCPARFCDRAAGYGFRTSESQIARRDAASAPGELDWKAQLASGLGFGCPGGRDGSGLALVVKQKGWETVCPREKISRR